MKKDAKTTAVSEAEADRRRYQKKLDSEGTLEPVTIVKVVIGGLTHFKTYNLVEAPRCPIHGVTDWTLMPDKANVSDCYFRLYCEKCQRESK